jgi:alkylation response protein AidB-like acyl-CoA dehydrogenase
MDLLPDEAQQEIIDQTTAFLDEAMPIDRFRAHGSGAARPDAAQLAQIAELGWFGMAIAEERGGVGFSLAEEMLLFREIGRHVGSASLLAISVAAQLAEHARDDTLLGRLVAGELRVGWAESLAPTDLTRTVSGDFQVFDGTDADLWISANASGAALLSRDAATRRESKPCLDEYTDLLHAHFADAKPAASVGAESGLAERAAVLAAAMLVGLAEAGRDQASAYAVERVQFGKPIGVFQAVKHPCADMAVRCEAAWSQTAYAGMALDEGLEDAAFQVSAAKSLAGDAAFENAAANVQIHGGYGFTTEYDAHLLVKRAHVLNSIAGTPRQHLQRVLAAPVTA